jgi:hypothetical protein
MPWRPRRLLVTAAARTIASWDAVVRLPARAHLLWLAQQITEARTTAQATLDPPEAVPARLPDVLDLALAPQLLADHMPVGAQQLADALRAARRTAGQLAAAPRSPPHAHTPDRRSCAGRGVHRVRLQRRGAPT